MTKRAIVFGVLCLAALAGCGEAPLGSLGDRSADWINEPTVPSTAARVVAPPSPVSVEKLAWANDEILNSNFDDTEAFLADVFERREGDRFIQASRTEIAFALPGVLFPGQAPPGAEWVSSQLVFDNDGSLSAEPSAAFGIWSAEPYTRSRSVAQMIILRVANDPEGAIAVSEEGATSCARFADETTKSCVFTDTDGESSWVVQSAAGTTVVWYQGVYRYELFGRTFVSQGDLEAMRSNMVALNSVEPTSGP